jgi:hypothetical protein
MQIDSIHLKKTNIPAKNAKIAKLTVYSQITNTNLSNSTRKRFKTLPRHPRNNTQKQAHRST